MRTLDQALLDTYTNMNATHSMDKEPTDAACWNWALYGLRQPPIPQPSILFAFVNRGDQQRTTRGDAEAALLTNTGHVWDNLQAGQDLRTELGDIRTDYDAATDDTATRNTIRDRVFELSIKAAGFTLSNAVTPYRICMYEPGDFVMWDHWWLEINGAVVETIPGDPLYAYSDQYLAPAFSHPRNRVANRTAAGGLSAARQERVHARYVTSLQDTQAGYLELLPNA
jgi:hypothetical protein